MVRSEPDMRVENDERAFGIRRILLGTFVLGVVGTAAELLLLEHIDGWQQIIPVALLASAVVVLGVQLLRPSRTANTLFLLLMCLFLAAGPVGVALHFQGNAEFEREMYPDMSGFELMRKTMTGATPVLAPGTMALLGLVGVAYLRVVERQQQRGFERLK
jgi:hypothetical protein